MATSLNDYLNLAIALGTLAGIIGAGLWRLRGLLRGDMEAITKKHVGPLISEQAKTNEEMIELRVQVNDHEKRIQRHSEDIQYIKGKEDARKEAAQAISGIGNAMSHAAKHPEEEAK